MQKNATLCTTISALLPGVTYSLSWLSTQRSGYAGNNLAVTVGSFALFKTGSMTRTTWQTDGPFTFVANATSSQLCFITTNPLGNDTTTLVDNVILSLVGAAQPPPPPFGLALVDGRCVSRATGILRRLALADPVPFFPFPALRYTARTS